MTRLLFSIWKSLLLSAHWYALVLVVSTCAIRAEQVLISEIMYHPPEGMPAWVEIQINTATPFDMSAWKLTATAMEFVFPEPPPSDLARTLDLAGYRWKAVSSVEDAAHLAFELLLGHSNSDHASINRGEHGSENH